MLVVSLGVVVLFLTTIIMPSMHPERSQELSTLRLIAPFTYAAVLLLMLYWIARWRPIMSAVMILMTIIGLFSVSSFYKIEFRRSYGEPAAERGEIKIMTYNARSFIDDNGALRSLSGKAPTVSVNLLETRAAARENGDGYEQLAFYQLLYLQCIFLMKYKSTDS
jgi:glucan phosphoethanolaminetransferase (alkaline phosphatase superfamily)